MNTNCAELQKFIRLPGTVNTCAWQTGKFGQHGGDWWLAAVLDVDSAQIATFLAGTPNRAQIETPPGLEFKAAFAKLQSLPGAQVTDTHKVRVLTDVFPVDSYASSPLLNGAALRLSPNEVFVVLRTQ